MYNFNMKYNCLYLNAIIHILLSKREEVKEVFNSISKSADGLPHSVKAVLFEILKYLATFQIGSNTSKLFKRKAKGAQAHSKRIKNRK